MIKLLSARGEKDQKYNGISPQIYCKHQWVLFEHDLICTKCGAFEPLWDKINPMNNLPIK